MGKPKLDARQFRRQLRAIEKDYNKKIEYLRNRREKKFSRLMKRVKEESTFKPGTFVAIKTTRKQIDSPFTPAPISSIGVIKEILPGFDGTIQFKVEILKENCLFNCGHIITCAQADEGHAYYDTENTEGVFVYTHKIKAKKSQM